MALSKIEWTDYTFSPWRGCTKVSEGCKNCYAEKLSHRNPGTLGIWGDNGTRVIAAESYWRQPHKWSKEAAVQGIRRRVFCASLADIFEDRPELETPRYRLFQLICDTPHLDWLLLTKRPAFARDWLARDTSPTYLSYTAYKSYTDLPNLWLGTSIENQATADERIPLLLHIPAAIRFLSCEPLLGPINLHQFICRHASPMTAACKSQYCGRCDPSGMIHWVIVGGESGPHARPMHPQWARSLRDQCAAASIPFFFKQWGEWEPVPAAERYEEVFSIRGRGVCFSTSGAFGSRVHDQAMRKVGKKAAGHLLDGIEHHAFPIRVNPCSSVVES